MTRLSANLGFLWPDRPLLARIDAAAGAGFRAVELHWPYDVPAGTLLAALERHGLALVGINTPVGGLAGDFGLAAVPGREAEFRSDFAMTLDYAQATGASAIHVMAGVIEPAERQAAQQTLVANLKTIAPAAEAAGVKLLLEAINRRDKPGYFYDGVAHMAEIIAATGHSAVAIMFDTYHAAMNGEDVLESFARHQHLVGHLQIASVPHRHEPDEGELDYAHVLREIAALDYRGWVGCEYRPRTDTDSGLGWREALLQQ